MNYITLRSELATEAGRYYTRRAALLWLVVRALDAVIAFDNARAITEHVQRVNSYAREGIDRRVSA